MEDIRIGQMNHSTALVSIQMLESINAALRARIEAVEPPRARWKSVDLARYAATAVSLLLMGAAVGVIVSWS
jgi:hypothetical protein